MCSVNLSGLKSPAVEKLQMRSYKQISISLLVIKRLSRIFYHACVLHYCDTMTIFSVLLLMVSLYWLGGLAKGSQ